MCTARSFQIHRDVPADCECGASHQRHTKIRPWSDAISTRRSRLAGRLRAHQVQTVSAGVEVFTRLCTAVSCRTMCTGRRRLGAPQSALCHSRTTNFPSVQHDKLWPTSILVRRSSCPELTARISATDSSNQPLQALAKTFLFGQLSRLAH